MRKEGLINNCWQRMVGTPTSGRRRRPRRRSFRSRTCRARPKFSSSISSCIRCRGNVIIVSRLLSSEIGSGSGEFRHGYPYPSRSPGPRPGQAPAKGLLASVLPAASHEAGSFIFGANRIGETALIGAVQKPSSTGNCGSWTRLPAPPESGKLQFWLQIFEFTCDAWLVPLGFAYPQIACI